MRTKSIVLFACALLAAGCSDTAYDDRTAANDTAPPAPTYPEPAAPAPATPTTEPAPAPATAATTAATTASATGKVDSIDSATGAITIAHDPVDALGWPAMTMAFKATPAQLASVDAGDTVTFVFDTAGSQATIVSIAAVDAETE